MYTKQHALIGAITAFVLGLLASLLTPTGGFSEDGEPLDTNAAMMLPSHTMEVPTPPPDPFYLPDSRKDHNTAVPPSASSVASVIIAPPSVVPAAATPVVKKPKAPTERAQQAPATPSTATSSVAEKAIAYATSKLGRPYIWGATGPNAFDCSGLVQAAFKSAGVSLPRTTKTIISRGNAVSRSALQRGDLIWTSSGHMGIYLGDSKMIHAPQPGDVVRVQTVWSFYTARRI